jgi:hypothetical protein
LFLIGFFSAFIPVIYAQGNENSNNNEHYFTNGIEQVFAEFVFSEQLLTDFSEEFDHELGYDITVQLLRYTYLDPILGSGS